MGIRSSKCVAHLVPLVVLVVLTGVTIGIAPASASSGTGTLSGTVTVAQTGTGVARVCVTIYQEYNGAGDWHTTTATDGTFSFSGLASSSYDVDVDPTCNGVDTSPYDIVWIPLVAVTSGSATSGVNAALVPGGSASGTVVDASTKDGVAGVCLELQSTTAQGEVASTESSESGAFDISNLSPGTYNFLILPNCDGDVQTPYESQTWPEQITITAGSSVTNLNVALLAGASISGTVTSAETHVAVAGAVVTASWASGPHKGDRAGYDVANSDGLYEITGLSTGPYVIDCAGLWNSKTGGSPGPYTGEDLSLNVTAGSALSNKDFLIYLELTTIPFTTRQSTLDDAQKRTLLATAKTFVPHGVIIVTGYAPNNRNLAKERADAAAAYMKSKVGVVSTIKIVTNSSLNRVVINNEGGTRDTAS
jgi:hypothetical protein